MLAPSRLAEALGGVIELRLVGEVFAENALAAACAAHAVGTPGPAIVRGLGSCAGVPGRFELLGRAGPVVAVDYAHTPDALTRTCATARALAGTGRVIVVFGAGGDTDAGKRGPMGEAVGAAADVAVVTTDNPRHEDPREIAAMLIAGIERGGRARVIVEADRGLALALALAEAGPHDVVVVAGKGHETGQTIGGETLPFSDREELGRCSGWWSRERAGGGGHGRRSRGSGGRSSERSGGRCSRWRRGRIARRGRWCCAARWRCRG
jgi:UDP-N-acetylmuramoyl-L-alanyl-D-glutamate--2,6-diaminopimelate ligase